MGDGGLKTNLNREYTRIYANSPSRGGRWMIRNSCETSKSPLPIA